ncbi:MAG: FecR domain-containing protein [Leptospiraceae bacterium]|nr:FecR domain-containing protein [Leptospiraceae bacterium]MCP5510800.1 FecR domain-containing protein [Leptospiraceae bacterium]
MSDPQNHLDQLIEEILLHEGKNELSEPIEKIKTILNQKPVGVEFPDWKVIKEKAIYTNLNQSRKKTMNKKILVSILAAAILLIAIGLGFNRTPSGTDSSQEAKLQVSAKVKLVSGEVMVYLSADQEPIKATVGMDISLNQLITTANKSFVDLIFNNGSSIRVKSNTELTLKKLVYKDEDSTEEIFLKRGVVIADIKKKKQTDNFNIVTPTVIAGVRGTKFQVEVNPIKGRKHSTKISVADGSVAVTQHKDEVPLSSEPIQILEKNEQAVEKGFGGQIEKINLDSEGITKEFDLANDFTNSDLLKLHNRTELEKLTLEGDEVYRGVVTGMDDNYLYIHTLDGRRKVEKNKVISSETESAE